MRYGVQRIKNCMLSSPAGSGKTRALTERFVHLLVSGEIPDPRRILAITFTNDAASEMRRRIIQKIRNEYPKLYQKIYRNLAHLRIQTFHSFSKRLVERFAFELGYDPGLKVIESSELLFRSVFRKRVLRALFHEEDEIAPYISESPTKLANLEAQLLDYLHHRPQWDFLDGKGDAQGIENLDLFWLILREFQEQKQSLGYIDFSDMELKAYELLYRHKDWSLVLEAFDEVTDHLLVDEFQDTNLLQWALISKLTEEWRAGVGAKSEKGVTPSIFIVGDENQSIYMFRGANVEVFKNAKRELEYFYHDNFEFIVNYNNYRSLQAIIDFVNFVFQKLFTGEDKNTPWKTKYNPFVKRREINAPGSVTILDIKSPQDHKNKIEEFRELEAEAIAKWILYYKEKGVVYGEDGIPRKPEFKDFAILLRTRRGGFYEPTLRRYNIPYNSLVERGFFEEPEVITILSVLKLIIFPTDTNSIFHIIASAIGKIIDEKTLERFLFLLGKDPVEAITDFKNSVKPVREFLESRDSVPLATALEKFLIETQFYTTLNTPQAQQNIDKFIQMIMELDIQGQSWRRIAKTIIQQEIIDVKKPQVIDPELNAVTLTTIHSAKGLQWHIVIVPSFSWLSRKGQDRFGFVEYFDTNTGYKTFLTTDRSLLQSKFREEEKRILYVAYTRAMDALMVTYSSDIHGRFTPISIEYLRESLNLKRGMPKISGLRFMRYDALRIEPEREPISETLFPKWTEFEHTDPIELKSYPEINPMALDVQHSEGQIEHKGVVFGEVFHEGIALYLLGRLYDEGQLLEWAHKQFRNHIWEKGVQLELVKEFERHFENLKRAPEVGKIIQRKLKGKIHVELPVLLKKKDGKNYFGRIDLVHVENNGIVIFDYKTTPVTTNIERLVNTYRPQIQNYKEALRLIYRLPVKGFLVFTDIGTTIEVK